ncbi:hypothetical protein MHF_1204 [Mycoplasma haemofelis Ohio2]|uniref:Uncharacterized protein n=1 Tax=Mycoplasma haemofelis (strain Ohio2) TaxID=859194 RepID=F6FJT9_MYCHI|nr:hypothetical protein MHF_1204 [Mycoplasma haemofelis Ohio2]
MLLPKVVKPVIGLAGLSAVGAGGMLLYGSPSPSFEKPVTHSFRDLMLSKHRGRRLISGNANSSHWLSGWKIYLESKENNPWNLSSWSPNNTWFENVPSDFMKACEDNSERDMSGANDPLYDQVIKYCTRNTTVLDLIDENASGRELMAKVTGLSDTHWNAALRSYKDELEKTKSDVWGLKKDGQSSEITMDAFMDKCLEESSAEAWDISSPTYTRVLSWCTKAKQQDV